MSDPFVGSCEEGCQGAGSPRLPSGGLGYASTTRTGQPLAGFLVPGVRLWVDSPPARGHMFLAAALQVLEERALRRTTVGTIVGRGAGSARAPRPGREREGEDAHPLLARRSTSLPYVHDTAHRLPRPDGREAPAEPGFITPWKEMALVDSKNPKAKPLPIAKMMVHHFLYFAGGRVDQAPGSCWPGAGFIGGRGEEHPFGRVLRAPASPSATATGSTTAPTRERLRLAASPRW